MTGETALAELSRVLFAPVTMVLYAAAMGGYLYALAFAGAAPGRAAGLAGRVRWLATAVAGVGVATHLAHLVTRSVAAGGRVPWGTMFEYSSVSGLLVVLAGLVIFQWRLGRPEVVGFLLLGALLTMAAALMLYSEPGPLQPILDSQWLKIHVLAILLAAAVFTVGFVLNALQLLRDTAERRLSGSPGPAVTAAPSRLRATIDPRRLVLGTALATSAVSWVFVPASASPALGWGRFLAVDLGLGLAALVGWWFLPRLPPAATLDDLARRTITFAFPLWTFAVLAGAVWAEQSWGRYWGWDPKETSAFLTWVAYAGYLHARATRGLRGRGAAWLGMAAFAVLMFTYYAVNLVVTGLHSYGGLPG